MNWHMCTAYHYAQFNITTTQNSCDNIPSHSNDSHHCCSDIDYWRAGGQQLHCCSITLLFIHLQSQHQIRGHVCFSKTRRHSQTAEVTWVEKAASQISVPRAMISCDVWLVRITGSDITWHTVQQNNHCHLAGKNQSVSVMPQLVTSRTVWT